MHIAMHFVLNIAYGIGYTCMKSAHNDFQLCTDENESLGTTLQWSENEIAGHLRFRTATVQSV